jgi:streptomycin 6-kinase
MTEHPEHSNPAAGSADPASGPSDPASGPADPAAGVAGPAILDAAARRWSLQLGSPYEPGVASLWVGSARDAEGQTVVLKLAFAADAGDEGRDEAEGLRAWNGNGAIRLIDSCQLDPHHLDADLDADLDANLLDSHTLDSHQLDGAEPDATPREAVRALLLEACSPGVALAQSLPPLAQDAVVAGLLRKLWVQPPAGHRFRPLRELCDDRAESFEATAAGAKPAGRHAAPVVLDAGLVAEGLAVFRDLPRQAYRSVLLSTDLHSGNVLSSRREPWLMIDPKPYVGDPTYDVTQHLLNSPERLAIDPHGFAGRMANLLDLDRRRVLDWLFARCVLASADDPAMAAAAAVLARR